jgi:hypothetical protein
LGGARLAVLVAEQNQVGAPANVELSKEIRDVELHGTLGNVEAVGDFLICEILQESVQHFPFAIPAKKIGNPVSHNAVVGPMDRI